MLRLSVNVDHVATIRQARRVDEPDPVAAAALAELAGAGGITVHLREDRRHIQDRDLQILRETVKTRLTLEMAATEELVSIAKSVGPDMVTLVPEKRQELTTEGGLNLPENREILARAIKDLHSASIPVSLFIDPEERMAREALSLGADAVELHTGLYCDAESEEEREKELGKLAQVAKKAYKAGLRVHAGHGLNYRNVQPVAAIRELGELSIGHSIVARAVMVGFYQAVRDMIELIKVARDTGRG